MQKKEQFSMFMLYFKSNQDNGAMLATYLFRYTSECTISWSNFQNFVRLKRQRGIDPLTKILRTFLARTLRQRIRFDDKRK